MHISETVRNVFSFMKDKTRSFRMKTWPSLAQWKLFFSALSKKEKIALLILVLIAITSFSFISVSFYFKNTKIQPASGGTHIEGVVGQPRFINPIYANSDIDRDLTQLLFAGLMKYDENLQVVPDMVENYKIEEDGKVYKFYLKKDIVWQDNTPLTAEDVIFTIIMMHCSFIF